MEWISVKDNIKPDREEVLVYMKDRGVFMGNFWSGKWHLFYCDNGRSFTPGHQNNITHWMPLPKPPKP